MANLRANLLYAKKAVATLSTLEVAAVSLGLLNDAVSGYVTAGLGAVTAAIVFYLDNGPKPAKP